MATHVFLKILYERYFLKEKNVHTCILCPGVCKKKSDLLVHFWSTYSVRDFGLGASDGPAKGQESSESSS